MAMPEGVAACSSTRIGGVSLPPYDSLNLGAHCGDNLQHVEENRGGCLPRRTAVKTGLAGAGSW
jgi:copper oxidase (laccase) domain-containing protein